MGISTEQWRARIGTYNGGRGRRVCAAHQSSFSHHAVFWTTGEIMSTTPLTAQAGVAFVSLWMVLCAISCWWKKIESSHPTKLNRGGSYHWSKDIRATVSITVCVSLVTAAAVLLHCLTLLLIMAGDVELNPGPGMDTALTITSLPDVLEKFQILRAHSVWYNLGVLLNVNVGILSDISKVHQDEQCMREVLTHRLQAHPPLTWRDLCDSLRSPTVGRHDVATKIEEWISVMPAKRKLSSPETILSDEGIHCQLPVETKKFKEDRKESYLGVPSEQPSVTKSDAPLPMETEPPAKVCALEMTKALEKKDGMLRNHELLNNSTFLHSAACSGNLLKVQAYIQLQHYNPQDFDRQGEAALHVAVKAGHLDVVQYFVEKCQISPLLKDENGSMPLHFAAMCGHQHMMEYFITRGADPLHCNVKGETPLLLSFLSGDVQSVKYLINEAQKRASMDTIVNSTNVASDTVLHYAVLSHSLELLKFLLSPSFCLSGSLTSLLESKNKYGSLPIHIACQEGCTDIVQYLLLVNQGSKVVKDNCGWSLLHYAALADTSNVLKYLLLEENANPMSLDVLHCTPLHFAAAKGCLESVRFLIEHDKCDPNVCNIKEFSPLFYACSRGNMSVVEYLIEDCRCNTLCKSIDSEFKLTVCLSAARYGQYHVVRRYLMHIDPCDSDKSAKEILCALIIGSTYLNRVENLDIAMFMKYFSEELNFDLSLNSLNGPLMATCMADSVQCVKYFLEDCKCDPLMRYDDGLTLLHQAASVGAIDVARYLVCNYQLDPMSVDKNGNSPMHWAALTNEKEGTFPPKKYYDSILQSKDVLKLEREERVALEVTLNCSLDDDLKFLREKGEFSVIRYLCNEMKCNADSVNNIGQTPLHIACENGHLNIVKFLIEEMNCSKSLRDNNGLNVLGFAIASGCLEIIKYLIIEHKLDPNYAIAGEGKSLPAILFCSGKVTVLKQLFEELPCNPRAVVNDRDMTWLHFACIAGGLECVQYFLKMGYNVNCRDKERWTPFHMAVFWGYLDIVKYMSSLNECDVECATLYDETPAHMAAMRGHLTILEHICDQASITSLNNQGQSPLHLACIEGHLEVVKFFIEEMKCNKLLRDRNGMNALDYAIRFGHLELIKYFVYNCAEV